MVEIIQELLLTSNCVIVPNFGAFIGNYAPADIRLYNKTIVPPNKLLAFNRALQSNDGVLINATARHFLISYAQAEEKVNEFVQQCQHSIQQNKSLILKDIGRFTLNNENNIQFQPLNGKNYLLDSYGLPVMSLDPIYRLKDNEQAVKESYQRILHPERVEDAVTIKTKPYKKAYWFAAVLALVLAGSSMLMNSDKNKLLQGESSVISIFDTAPKNEAIIEKQSADIVSTESTAIVDQAQAIVPPAQLQQAAVSKNKSYIVIGAFFDESRANKMKMETEAKGYEVNISKDETNNLFRTTIQVENMDVETSLRKIKSEINQRAWIYCVQCNL